MSSGVLERLAAHWLTSTKEREFQLAYCQLLLAEGFRVLDISVHGPGELGKDITAIAPDGVPCGFQLKIDDIGLHQWRTEVWPECEELLELPLRHPGIRAYAGHRSYLVTTGNLSDPVRADVTQRNEERKRKRRSQLNVVVQGELLRKFVDAHASVLPWDPRSYRSFFELYGSDGSAPLDRVKFCSMLEQLLPFTARFKRPRDYSAAISRALLIANYVTATYTASANHWALVDAWTLAAMHVMACADAQGLTHRQWEPAYEIALAAVRDSCRALCDEARRAKRETPTGLAAGVFEPSRTTVLIGVLSALVVSDRLSGHTDDAHHSIWDLCRKRAAKAGPLIGESFLGSWLAYSWAALLLSESKDSDEVLSRLLARIVFENGRARKGIPSPYYSPEDTIRWHLTEAHGIDVMETLPHEDFRGHSYGLRSVIELCARRNLRQAVAAEWRGASHIACAEVQPSPSWRILTWRSKQGIQRDTFPPEQQSWRELVKVARRLSDSGIPPSLIRRPELLPFILLSAPQRIHPKIVRWLDSRILDLI